MVKKGRVNEELYRVFERAGILNSRYELVEAVKGYVPKKEFSLTNHPSSALINDELREMGYDVDES